MQTESNPKAKNLLKLTQATLRQALGVLGLVTLGLLAGATAQAQDDGSGVDTRVLTTYGKKQTKFENLTPPFSVKKGATVTLRAQLYYYSEKQRKWLYLGYGDPRNPRTASLTVSGNALISRPVSLNDGYATFQYTVPVTTRVGANGSRVNWHVGFSGDNELKSCNSNSNSFTVFN